MHLIKLDAFLTPERKHKLVILDCKRVTQASRTHLRVGVVSEMVDA